MVGYAFSLGGEGRGGSAQSWMEWKPEGRVEQFERIGAEKADGSMRED